MLCVTSEWNVTVLWQWKSRLQAGRNSCCKILSYATYYTVHCGLHKFFMLFNYASPQIDESRLFLKSRYLPLFEDHRTWLVYVAVRRQTLDRSRHIRHTQLLLVGRVPHWSRFQKRQDHLHDRPLFPLLLQSEDVSWYIYMFRNMVQIKLKVIVLP